MVIYNSMNVAWSDFNLNMKDVIDLDYTGKSIIANDCLFFAQICYSRKCNVANKFISILEINIIDTTNIAFVKTSWCLKMLQMSFLLICATPT